MLALRALAGPARTLYPTVSSKLGLSLIVAINLLARCSNPYNGILGLCHSVAAISTMSERRTIYLQYVPWSMASLTTVEHTRQRKPCNRLSTPGRPTTRSHDRTICELIVLGVPPLTRGRNTQSSSDPHAKKLYPAERTIRRDSTTVAGCTRPLRTPQ